MLTAAVFTLDTTAATENIALVTLAAFSARVSTVQWGGEVRAGSWTGTGAHLVLAELLTRQS